MQIRPADFAETRLNDLLRTHLTRALEVTPRHSAHALDLSALQVPAITVWTGWNGDTPVTVGALFELTPDHGEVKSMHTAQAHRGAGHGRAMLRHIVATARTRGYARLSLETGMMAYFAPARALSARHGFVGCEAFGGYAPDPNSAFITLTL